MQKRLFLLDGMALAYRAHFAFIARPIRTSSGVNTSALFGFASTLLDLVENEKPTHMAVVFDTSAPTARHQLFPDYKANRDEMPEDLAAALPHLRRFAQAFGIPVLAMDGYEADDLIGTLATRAATGDFVTFMVTPDKDFGQLVSDRVLIYKPGLKGDAREILGVSEVLARWEIKRVDQVIDMLGLVGDTADNIPGVPGVGPKTARKLIAEFDSLENLLAHTAEVKGKLREKLEQFADQARLSKTLATIDRAVPLDTPPDALELGRPDAPALQALLAEFEFRSLAKRAVSAGAETVIAPAAQAKGQGELFSFSESGTPRTDSPDSAVAAESAQLELGMVQAHRTITDLPHTYEHVTDEAGRTALAERLRGVRSFCFDTETDGIEARTAELVGFSICWEPHRAFFVRMPMPSPAPTGAGVADPAPTVAGVADPGPTAGLSEASYSAAAQLVEPSLRHQPGAGVADPGPTVAGVADPGPAAGLSEASYSAAARAALEPFRAIFADPAIEKVGHNLKFDLAVLKRCGIEVGGRLFDTMLAHALIEPDQRHGMDYLSEALLDYTPIPLTRLIGEEGAGPQRRVSEVDPSSLAEYGAEDADVTLQLRAKLEPMLRERGQERVFHDVEMPLVRVLVDMEHEGIALDTGALAAFGKTLEEQAVASQARIFEMVGRPFNLNSPKQLGEILFDELKLADKPKKTRTGQYATNEQTLLTLAHRHPVVRAILEHRETVKLKSTYVDALPAAVDPATGRVHTHYGQLRTATGRLNSDNPNLQNIPVRSEQGREIRRAFVARGPEWLLLSADYSQIELRIIAALSRDPGMLEAFARGDDIHTATAAKVYGVPPAEVTREMRARAKMVNFGIPYGISAFGLAQRLACSRTEADELIKGYFGQFGGIRAYIDGTLEFARAHGYVETVTGRRRYLPDINSANGTTRAAAERNAINTPIQGSAADMIKIAMAGVHADLRTRGLRTRLLLQVHDELLFELFRPEEAEVRALAGERMRTALPLDVPIAVEIGTGANWLDAH